MMATPQQLQVAAAAYILMNSLVARRKRNKRRWWTTKFLTNREECGGGSLLADLKFQQVSGMYKNFTRMHPTDFEFILNAIGPKITKSDTSFRKAITAQDRLSLTLRFLATGDSYASLQFLFKVSKQAISGIIPEVCGAIVEVLLGENMQMPATQEDWVKISDEFDTKWNFPHCIGAMDGKHVQLQKPINSGSEFINYKGFFSIVLLAVVDANYNFLFVDVGCQGRISDGGVFSNTELNNRMERNMLNLPEPVPLEGREKDLPYYLLVDEAFGMTENMLKCFPGYHAKGSRERIFNYRHCRARRVVENVFGILASVFRVLRKPMLLEPEKAEIVVLAVTVLHNFLRRRPDSVNLYTPPGTFDAEERGGWRGPVDGMGTLQPLQRIARRTRATAREVREELCDYFLNEGRLTWQDDYA